VVKIPRFLLNPLVTDQFIVEIVICNEEKIVVAVVVVVDTTEDKL
jgi:hypothetical protein